MLSRIPAPVVSKLLRPNMVSGPSVEPVTTDDYASFVRVAANFDPTIIENKLVSARELCEEYTGRKFVSQVWDMYLDLPPGENFGNDLGLFARFVGYYPEALDLSFSPLITVNGVYITDDSGTETLIDPGVYWVSRATNTRPRISLRQTQVWPDTGGRTFETFRINATFGYGTDGTNVPMSIKRAILATAEADLSTETKKTGYAGSRAGANSASVLAAQDALPAGARERLNPFRVITI